MGAGKRRNNKKGNTKISLWSLTNSLKEALLNTSKRIRLDKEALGKFIRYFAPFSSSSGTSPHLVVVAAG